MKKLHQVILTQILVCGIMVMPSRAADPIAGDWKLDVKASKFAMEAPQEQRESYKELASGEIELTLTRIAKDGKQSTVNLSWPAAGGAVQDPAGALGKGKSAVETLLDPGVWLVTVLENGKQWSTMRKVISPDGRTMTQTAKFVDAQGRTLIQIQVLRRQSQRISGGSPGDQGADREQLQTKH
jgi:hypothetical protein